MPHTFNEFQSRFVNFASSLKPGWPKRSWLDRDRGLGRTWREMRPVGTRNTLQSVSPSLPMPIKQRSQLAPELGFGLRPGRLHGGIGEHRLRGAMQRQVMHAAGALGGRVADDPECCAAPIVRRSRGLAVPGAPSEPGSPRRHRETEHPRRPPRSPLRKGRRSGTRSRLDGGQ